MIRPGEIYMADLDAAGLHPVLVLSREELNRGHTVVAVLITSAKFDVRSKLANCVPFKAGQFGLTKDCVAQCEFMLAVEVGQIDLDAGPIGELDETALRDVIRASGYVIEADCEPS
jgi:mRNA-degrading endonuclease toxin of MazEF toxin-antitoxin module